MDIITSRTPYIHYVYMMPKTVLKCEKFSQLFSAYIPNNQYESHFIPLFDRTDR